MRSHFPTWTRRAARLSTRPRLGGRRPALLAGPGLLVLALALLFAAPAYASYELVQDFGEGAGSGPRAAEEGLGSSPAGVAVNDTTGDVYVADHSKIRVMRFDSHGNFREAWGWGVGDGKQEYERCGPEGTIEHCEGSYDTGKGLSGEGAGELGGGPQSIAIDQSTGEVYVGSLREKSVIQVFSSHGALITGFGDRSKEPVSATPEMLHDTMGIDGMVVDPATGDAYVLDALFGPESRVAVFKPKTPARQEYEYSEALFPSKYSSYAQALAEDASGDFYLSHDEVLYKFDKGDFVTPVWEKPVPEADGMTVEPSSGDLLRYATHSTKIERYSAANGEVTETFSTGETGLSFSDGAGVFSLALNPDLSWSPGRPPGVIYGDVPFATETKREAHMFALTQLPVAAPRVDSESASFIGSSSATLTAQVNPDGYQTRYRFQYGTEPCSSHACAEAPLGGAALGAGSANLAAGAELLGLQPETTYHYRVLATNLYGDTVEGAEQMFTTYPTVAPGLPDGRAYELVSPAEKNGGEVFPPNPNIASCVECKPGNNSASDPMQSAADGNAVVYEGEPFARTGDAIEQNEYRSRRTATGWQTEDLSPSVDPAGLPFKAVSTDLSMGVLPWQAGNPLLSPEAPAGLSNIYLREADGAMRPLLAAQYAGMSKNLELLFAGPSAASSDFSHVVFEANLALTGQTSFAPAAQDAAEGKYNLYEWFDGQLRLVNVLPGNTVTVPDARLGARQEGYEAFDATNAVSKDGSRVFWTDETGQVYVRENGESTVEIPDTARFLAASGDGSKVLLRDGLIFELSGGGTPVETANLTGGLEGFQGILGASEDLSRVYFVDTEALTGEEQNGHGAVARSGGDNLYLYEAASGSTRFIATLTAEDDNESSSGGLAGDWKPSLSDRTAQITPDGRYLAFVSHASLTGYENEGVSEVFEYDAEAGRLACASCNPSGVPPLGGSRLSLIRPITSNFPQPRNLSDDGRVFFDSSDALSPFDGNGSVEDVYEYEPDGLGSCTRTVGCIFLISSGHSSADSNFVAASPSGSDVFFATRDRLVPADKDQLYDLYDARVGGGFPELTAPVCTGTGCQGVPGAPPIFATPSSVTFAGVGNFDSTVTSNAPSGTAKTKKKPAKCPKGKALKHGRCAKARRARSSAGRASHGHRVAGRKK